MAIFYYAEALNCPFDFKLYMYVEDRDAPVCKWDPSELENAPVWQQGPTFHMGGTYERERERDGLSSSYVFHTASTDKIQPIRSTS